MIKSSKAKMNVKKFFEINGIGHGIVKVKDLIVDHAYQRDLQIARVRGMGDFRWTGVGVPVVAYRPNDGKFAVIDGQHRLAKIREKFPTLKDERNRHVECLVQIVEGNQVIEAEIFWGNNKNMKPPTANQCFKAELVAEHEVPLRVTEILGSHDITLAFGRGRLGPNQTKSAAAMKWAFELLGEDRFEFFASVLSVAFQRPDDNGVIELKALSSAEFLRGMARFIGASDLPDESIILGLKNGWSADAIMKAVSIRVNGSCFSKKRVEIVSMVIRESIKNGLKKLVDDSPKRAGRFANSVN